METNDSNGRQGEDDVKELIKESHETLISGPANEQKLPIPTVLETLQNSLAVSSFLSALLPQRVTNDDPRDILLKILQLSADAHALAANASRNQPLLGNSWLLNLKLPIQPVFPAPELLSLTVEKKSTAEQEDEKTLSTGATTSTHQLKSKQASLLLNTLPNNNSPFHIADNCSGLDLSKSASSKSVTPDCSAMSASNIGGEKCDSSSTSGASAALPPKKERKKYTTKIGEKGEKRYVCEYCSKQFAQAPTLIAHRRIHTGEKPYKCPICNAAFKQVTHRNDHVNSHDANYRPFVCQTCGRGFARKYSLSIHSLIHQGVYRFSCEYCGKQFRQSADKKKHELRHLK